jgi:hypothetical protein
MGFGFLVNQISTLKQLVRTVNFRFEREERIIYYIAFYRRRLTGGVLVNHEPEHMFEAGCQIDPYRASVRIAGIQSYKTLLSEVGVGGVGS